MTYLDPSEYEQYGLEAALPESWATAASALIDAHCGRPTLGVRQYTERLRVTAGRNTVRLTHLPLAAVAPATTPIVQARARFANPRRGETLGGGDLAADVAAAFGLPGSWTTLNPDSVEYFAETGEVAFGLHPLGLTFNEVEIVYTAGYAEIPSAVKLACAQLIRNAQATPALNVRAGTVDKMHMEYFADNLLDASVRLLLREYVSQNLAA